MRSRSASATADKMVNTNLLMPLLDKSPPRSSMWSAICRSRRSVTTLSASMADRNIRSSFGTNTMSPG
jgi:hypothetical protein